MMTPVITAKAETIEGKTADDATARDERQWDGQFAESLDVLEDLYDEITADQQAGRTRPINV